MKSDLHTVLSQAVKLSSSEDRDFGTRAEALHALMISPIPSLGLQHLVDQEVLHHLFPAVHRLVGFGGSGSGHKDLWEHTKKVVDQTPRRLHLRWAALFHDVGKIHTIKTNGGLNKISFHGHEVLSSKLFLKASRSTNIFDDRLVRDIEFLIRHLGKAESYDSSWTDSAVRRFSRVCGEYVDDIIDLSKADITTKHSEKRERIIKLLSELQERSHTLLKEEEKPTLPKGLGSYLIENFGLTPDRSLGLLMTSLTQALENGEIHCDATFSDYADYCLAESLIEK